MGTVEVFKLRRKDFDEFWSIQAKKVSKSMVYNFLKLQVPFSELCEATLSLLTLELMQKSTFKAGELIISQDRRSPLNLAFSDYFRP